MDKAVFRHLLRYLEVECVIRELLSVGVFVVDLVSERHDCAWRVKGRVGCVQMPWPSKKASTAIVWMIS